MVKHEFAGVGVFSVDKLKKMRGNISDNGINLSVSMEASVFLVIFTSLQILIGSLANFIVIITILTATELQKRSEDLFILSLGVVDLISLTTFLPWHAYVLSQRKIRGGFTYFIYESLNTLVISCGANAILAIAIDRFVAVVFPFRHKTTITRRKTYILIALTWGVAIAFGIIDLLRYLATHHPYVDLWLVIYSFSLMLAIVVVYFIIFCYTRKQGKNILHQRRSVQVERESHSNHVLLKITLNTFVLVCLYYITYLPVAIYVVYTSVAIKRPLITQITERSWIYSFLFFNSCINPFVYALRTKRFRRAFFGKIWSNVFRKPGRPASHRHFSSAMA